MILGAHSILYSRDADADRRFLRDVLAFPHVDAGEGWLVFGLPPAEVAVHPGDRNDVHEFYLMCDDVNAFVADMARRNVSCAEIRALGWGLLTEVTLPGGGRLGVYQPRHVRAKPMRVRGPAKKSRRKAAASVPRRRKRRAAHGSARRTLSPRRRT